MSTSTDPDASELAAALRRMGLVECGELFQKTSLAGGVSCDVWLITHQGGPQFVVKRALPKLRVAADWRAPPDRSHTEVEWLRLVARIDERLVPKVLAEDRHLHLFALEYLPPDAYPLWKAQLASGVADPVFASTIGHALASIHSATAGDSNLADQFNNGPQFFALRLEPYLLHTAARHADVAPHIRKLADGVARARIALMQGDISPKNILCGPHGPVFLDAETACYGDPAFDLAFCLNHLLLKCVWHPKFADGYLKWVAALVSAYLQHVTWEANTAVERRTAELLPALMLARIDGKSPVEYITAETDKNFVRQFAREALKMEMTSLRQLCEAWRTALAHRQAGKPS